MFDLAVVQRLPYPRIAALLEIPVGTVKSRVFTAVRTLRGMLEEPSAERAGDGAGATGEQR